MQIQNNYPQNSFKSTWCIVNRKAFNIYANKIRPYEVLYPWTSKESIIAKDVFTRIAFDCKVDGVTNGEKAFMEHLDPNAPENSDFDKNDNIFLETIKPLRNPYLQGYVLGGKANNPYSPRSMESIYHTINLFEREKFPYTRMIGGPYENDFAYFTGTDTFFIGNDRADCLRKMFPDNPLEAAKQIFDDVQLCEFDEIKWQ